MLCPKCKTFIHFKSVLLDTTQMMELKLAENVQSVHSVMKRRIILALSVARISLLRPQTAQTVATAVSTIYKLYKTKRDLCHISILSIFPSDILIY